MRVYMFIQRHSLGVAFIGALLALGAVVSGAAGQPSYPYTYCSSAVGCPFGAAITASADFKKAMNVCNVQWDHLDRPSGEWIWKVGFEECQAVLDQYLVVLKQEQDDRDMRENRENIARNQADKALLDQFVAGLKKQ